MKFREGRISYVMMTFLYPFNNKRFAVISKYGFVIYILSD